MKKLISILIVSAWLVSCYAQPNSNDIARVKKQFLTMRFHAPFTEEWSGMSDAELFELSCKNNRIQCDVVLDDLKKNDSLFYSKLMMTE